MPTVITSPGSVRPQRPPTSETMTQLPGRVAPQATANQRRRTTTRTQRGQSLVEFALVLPFLLMLVLAIGDFSRWYSTAIAVQAAAREAADYGAFKPSRWEGDPLDPTSNYAKTIAEMKKLACTSASSLTGYAGDPVGTFGMSCTNPAVEDPTAIVLSGSNCSNPAQDPPCQVTVTLQYRFDLFIPTPLFSPSFTFSRDATFAVSFATS